MPSLKFMTFSLELGDLVEFEFRSRDSSLTPYLIWEGPSKDFTIMWASYLGYKPDAHVARAWGVEPKDMRFSGRAIERDYVVLESLATLDWLPPVE
jgi:hypothetical protein